jgi:hypothetical protein
MLGWLYLHIRDMNVLPMYLMKFYSFANSPFTLFIIHSENNLSVLNKVLVQDDINHFQGSDSKMMLSKPGATDLLMAKRTALTYSVG